jgi:hypothetical protein
MNDNDDNLAILLMCATVVLVVVYAGVRLLDYLRAIP